MPRSIKQWSTTDLKRIRALIADGCNSREIAPVFNVSRKAIIHIAAKHGLGPWIAKPGSKPGDTTHIPDDFAARYATSSIKALAAHYGRSTATVSTWCKRLGLSRPVGLPVKPKPRIVHHRYLTAPVDRAYVDTSLVGRAADYLRRFGPVYRCNAEGRPSIGGRFWRRGGGGVLTDAEIIERAEYNGFDAAAWRRCA